MATQVFTQTLQFISLQFPLPLVRKEKILDFPKYLGCFYIFFLSVGWKMATLGFNEMAVGLLISQRDLPTFRCHIQILM